MVVLGIPYPLVIGLLAGVVELIPIIGPLVGAIPPMLLGLLQSSSVMIKVIIFYVIVQQLDAHIIMPKLMGSVIKVHPVVYYCWSINWWTSVRDYWNDGSGNLF